MPSSNDDRFSRYEPGCLSMHLFKSLRPSTVKLCLYFFPDNLNGRSS
ncbi:MAG: hypothetical protein M1454_04570 [Candidatus Thermoplasmatota archaeon]|nr:hypothetical protein [Candidatus Thermoplasmatota archaeon]